MRKFWDNTREEENSEEETRIIDGNLNCEEQIMGDIERFGRGITVITNKVGTN